MKITLTDAQARTVIQALEWAQNDDYPSYDPYNRAYQRVIDKIRKELK